jgi:hypothetical protein
VAERDDLLAAIAGTIATYRQGELAVPTAAHVDRWASQFMAADQLPFLREFSHVVRQTFLTREAVVNFLAGLVRNPKLAGGDSAAYWARANVLQIQQAGQSQREMVKLFAETLEQQVGLKLAQCGAADGDYIYLDDILFTGNRVATDLEAWIAQKAPPKALLHVILMAFHTSGQWYLASNRLKKAIAASGKNITVKFWRMVELENARNRKDTSDVLWPAVVPADAAVQAYVDSEKKFPLVLRAAGGASRFFSSEAGRQVLEREFLIAGVQIRSKTATPKPVVRPLGFSFFGVGFGSLIATYRNCPNNCPLAIWWGDPAATSGALHWYPLLPRKTYSSPENVINDFEDLTI